MFRQPFQTALMASVPPLLPERDEYVRPSLVLATVRLYLLLLRREGGRDGLTRRHGARPAATSEQSDATELAAQVAALRQRLAEWGT